MNWILNVPYGFWSVIIYTSPMALLNITTLVRDRGTHLGNCDKTGNVWYLFVYEMLCMGRVLSDQIMPVIVKCSSSGHIGRNALVMADWPRTTANDYNHQVVQINLILILEVFLIPTVCQLSSLLYQNINRGLVNLSPPNQISN